MCTAACCRDDLSENSSSHNSSHSSRTSQTSNRVQLGFSMEEHETNGSSLDFFEAKVINYSICNMKFYKVFE